MAMDLLQAGVDLSVIALWLGHEHVETTQIYLEATLAMKEKALAKTSPGTPGRYKVVRPFYARTEKNLVVGFIF